MTFLELMDRVECDVLLDEGINDILETFIKNGKFLTTRFCSLKNDKNAMDESSINESEILAYRINLVKAYINAMYEDKCQGKPLGHDGKNVSKELLEKIKKLSDKQIIDICVNGNRSFEGANLIIDIYTSQTNFTMEHNGQGTYLVDRLKTDGRASTAGTKRIYLNSPESNKRYKFLYLLLNVLNKEYLLI